MALTLKDLMTGKDAEGSPSKMAASLKEQYASEFKQAASKQDVKSIKAVKDLSDVVMAKKTLATIDKTTKSLEKNIDSVNKTTVSTNRILFETLNIQKSILKEFSQLNKVTKSSSDNMIQKLDQWSSQQAAVKAPEAGGNSILGGLSKFFTKADLFTMAGGAGAFGGKKANELIKGSGIGKGIHDFLDPIKKSLGFTAENFPGFSDAIRKYYQTGIPGQLGGLTPKEYQLPQNEISKGIEEARKGPIGQQRYTGLDNLTLIEKSTGQAMPQSGATPMTTPQTPVGQTDYTGEGAKAKAAAEKYLGRGMSDQEWSALVKATHAEAGKNQTEVAMVAASILNRARQKNKDIIEILNEKNQFQSVTGTKFAPGPSANYQTGPGANRSGSIFGAIENITPNVSKQQTNFTSNVAGAYGPGTNPNYLKEGSVVGSSRFNTAPPTAGASSAGLSVKGGDSGQAFSGGQVNPGVLSLAQMIQQKVPGFNRFTAFNDAFHQGTNSYHAKGLAGDFTISDPGQSASAAAAVRELAKQMGANVTVLDEYKNPSSRATAGHIHYQFASEADAAKVTGGGKPSAATGMSAGEIMRGGIPGASQSTYDPNVNQRPITQRFLPGTENANMFNTALGFANMVPGLNRFLGPMAGLMTVGNTPVGGMVNKIVGGISGSLFGEGGLGSLFGTKPDNANLTGNLPVFTEDQLNKPVDITSTTQAAQLTPTTPKSIIPPPPPAPMMLTAPAPSSDQSVSKGSDISSPQLQNNASSNVGDGKTVPSVTGDSWFEKIDRMLGGGRTVSLHN